MTNQEIQASAFASSAMDGVMRRLIDDFDWTNHPLGPRDRWPAALNAALSLCLGSRFPMLIWWGPDHIHLYNDAYLPILGRRHPRALGQPASQVWPEFWKTIESQVNAIRRHGQATWSQEIHVVLERNGRPEDVWFTWSYAPVLDPSGAVLGLHGIGVEDTPRKAEQARLAAARDLQRVEEEKSRLLEAERAARAEAERAGRIKDEFLSTLSHELRSPLNAIIGWSQILLKQAPDGTAHLVDGLKTIERNARAQAQIIEDMLDMSHIVSGRARLEVQTVDLCAVLNDAIATVRAAADAKGIRLQADLDSQIGSITGDPRRLQQIFWNLLSNAVKFTPRGGRVQIVARKTFGQIEISVVDTGEGMKADFVPVAFDGFRQADASITRRHGGLGLGLAIVKQLVELHGGSIRARSDGSNQGSTFVVSLAASAAPPTEEIPRDRRAPHSADWLGAAQEQASIEGLKVLVVDDEADARGVVKRLLEDHNAIVTVAASAGEAIAQIQTDCPDVLISDIGMPEQDGYSLIRRVRALGRDQGGNVPALALTAYARSEDRTRSILAGYQMHVPKPVEPAELIAVVASLAGRRLRE